MTYQRKDAHYRRARAEGYRARSVYKLAELDRRYRILRRGDAVVDLGAWPGGWLQLAHKRVGSEGRVVGVDLAAIQKLPVPNVELVLGDVRAPGTGDAILEGLGRRADVVLSDLAPKLTGIRATDESRSPGHEDLHERGRRGHAPGHARALRGGEDDASRCDSPRIFGAVRRRTRLS